MDSSTALEPRLESKSFPYDNILIPTDGGGSTQPAIRHGLSLAQVHQATVHALHVVEDGSKYSGSPPEQLTQQEQWDAASAVETVIENAHPINLNVVPVIRSGSPVETICEYARENKIDLIALGTHTRSRFKRALHRSVSEQVRRNSPIPVLSVDQNQFTQTDDSSSTIQYTDVLVPTDGRKGATIALSHGIEIAHQYDALLHGLFVVDRQSIASRPGFTWKETTDSWTLRGRRILTNVAEQAASCDVDVRLTLTHGIPWKEIRDYTSENDIDLITTGTRGLTGIKRLLQPSVASRVIRKVAAPVITINRLTSPTRSRSQFLGEMNGGL
jgi:nucleotide-binding universal stress UspA family protein